MPLSFPSFWQQLFCDPLLMIAVVLTLGVILVNGWTDAPNAIASCVATRCLSVNAAILLAAICNFLGVFVTTKLGATIAVKITRMVRFDTDGAGDHRAAVALCAAMLAVVIWATLAWLFGIPTSESHALIAGLTGSAIALHAGLDGVSGKEWAAVLYGLLLSVFAGWALGFVTCKLTLRAFQGAKRYRTVGLFRHAQILGAACMAFMHGAQDGQKFMGVLLLCACLSTGDTVRAVIAPDWLMLLCACLMAAGTAIGGRRIIRSVGMNMVKLEKFQGFSADIAAAVLLLLCSVFALPVSTTHVKAMTILGVGTAKKPSSVHPGTVKSMALTWICTFPGCGLLAYVTARLFMHWF